MDAKVEKAPYDPIMSQMTTANTNQLLKWTWPLVLAISTGPTPALAQSLPNGVASGDTDQTSAILWARSTALGPVEFEYSTSPDFAARESVAAEVSDATIPVKVEIGGLSPGTQYFYRATNSEGESATGTFRTSHVEGFHGLRFGVSGDWRGELAPYPAVSNMPGRNLEFFVALGDTVYADIPSIDFPHEQAITLSEFRIKHNEVYRKRFGINSLAAVRASTSIFAMIDDHEVTNDFAGGAPAGSDPRFDLAGVFLNETEFFNNGLQVFQEYNPIRDEFYGETGDPRTAGKRKLYRYRTYGSDAAMILPDARSFRDEELPSLFNPFARRIADQFIADSFEPGRTMLGQVQLDDLMRDLLAAQEAGINWKFVLVPEPIQNLGPVLAGDRFEGYNYERTLILEFIEENSLTNVVFIAADIHSTIVNNLTYQRNVNDRQRPIQSFEITTGAVAYAAPFGPTILDFAPLGILTRAVSNFYNRLLRQRQDFLFSRLLNQLLRSYGYSKVGLDGSSIPVTPLKGRYLAVNTYGWTEFEIDADSQDLTITTYGIDWYDQEELLSHPDEVLSREPEIISQFRVASATGAEVPYDHTLKRINRSPCGALGAVGLLGPLGLMMLGHCRPRSRHLRP